MAMKKNKNKNKKGDKKPASQSFLSKNLLVIIVGVVVIGGIGIYSTQKGGASTPDGVSTSADGDIPELPDFAYASSASLKAYTVALEIPEVFERIPCYCGCVDMAHLSVKHKYLRDCYRFDDGTFDDHASYCDLCVYEALDVSKWHDQGVPLKEIRDRIDAKYGGGKYGPPTDTPPVV